MDCSSVHAALTLGAPAKAIATQKLSAVAINLALGTDPEGQFAQLFNLRKTELLGG